MQLDDLNVVALGYFQGNSWTGEAKPAMGIYRTGAPGGVSGRRYR